MTHALVVAVKSIKNVVENRATQYIRITKPPTANFAVGGFLFAHQIRMTIPNTSPRIKKFELQAIGGEGGIRTHVPVKANAFRVRPVMTTSILLQILNFLYVKP